jgi:Short C-terminal domain
MIAAPAASADDIVTIGDVDVAALGRSLPHDPVQVAGKPDPTLSRAHLTSLAARINEKDPSRIWIAVVSPFDSQQTGDVSSSLADYINKPGVVIVVSGSNYHVTTSWESGTAAAERLGRAVNHTGDSLFVQMRKAIDSFAKADAARHHPGFPGGQSQTATTDNQGAVTAPSTTSGPNNQNGGSSSGGLIAGIVILVLILIPATLFGTRFARRQMRASHWQREATADSRTQAEADLVKLGEDIGALDIDSSMPNASAQAKDEYAEAIDCYQEAERRLKNSGDAYQFAKGRDALARGQEHVSAAAALFGGGSAPLQTTPTSAGDTTMADQLQRLASLHDRGDLTDEEFAEQKRLLIGD